MHYPARFEPAEEGGFVVTFRDIPEAITQGDTFDEAMSMACEVLVLGIECYFDAHKHVPVPSAPEADETLVELPASVWAKVLLLNEMIAAKVGPSELARRMHTRPQDVNRIINLSHATKIDTLSRALAVLGKRLEVSVA